MTIKLESEGWMKFRFISVGRLTVSNETISLSEKVMLTGRVGQGDILAGSATRRPHSISLL